MPGQRESIPRAQKTVAARPPMVLCAAQGAAVEGLCRAEGTARQGGWPRIMPLCMGRKCGRCKRRTKGRGKEQSRAQCAGGEGGRPPAEWKPRPCDREVPHEAGPQHLCCA
eukprot:1838538-Heterocapsa_arctica.AAC.1